RDVQIESGTDEDERGQFLHAIRDVFGDTQWTAKELVSRIDIHGLGVVRDHDVLSLKLIPLDVLPETLAKTIARSPAAARVLGRWLQTNEESWALGSCVAKACVDPRSGTASWEVRVEDGS